jgi:hypothetical protein
MARPSAQSRDLSPLEALDPSQLIYMRWLLDPRPAKGDPLLSEDGVSPHDMATEKGTEAALFARLGTTSAKAYVWRSTVKFQRALRTANETNLADPLLRAMAKRRALQIIENGTDMDAVKVMGLLFRQVEAETKAAPPSSNSHDFADLSDEELEARTGESVRS